MPTDPHRSAPPGAPLDDPLPLALALMAAESTSGREGPAVDVAEGLLRERGWTVTRIPVAPGRDDLLATAGVPPEVVLSTHLDTVPPFIAPRVEEGRLHGRGACDAKGIAAAMIVAAGRLRDAGVPVALLLVVGEETTHDGARAANAWALARGVRPLVLVNGEPTESTLATGTKGALRMRLRTAGRPAHSAYPHLGDSATAKLARLLVELESVDLPRDETLGETTVNIGHLAGGVADNVVAPWAEARLMARLVGPAEEVVARLEGWLGDRATLEPSVMVPAVRLGTVPGVRTGVVAFATDIPELGAWGTPYLFGPGSIHVAHTDAEWIALDELRASVGSYERIARLALERARGEAGDARGEAAAVSG